MGAEQSTSQPFGEDTVAHAGSAPPPATPVAALESANVSTAGSSATTTNDKLLEAPWAVPSVAQLTPVAQSFPHPPRTSGSSLFPATSVTIDKIGVGSPPKVPELKTGVAAGTPWSLRREQEPDADPTRSLPSLAIPTTNKDDRPTIPNLPEKFLMGQKAIEPLSARAKLPQKFSLGQKMIEPLSARLGQFSARMKPGDQAPLASSRSAFGTTARHNDTKHVFEGMDGVALMAALSQPNQLRHLVSQGADINKRDPDGDRTALHWAACRDYIRCVEVLIEAGADKSALDAEGRTAAALALETGARRCHDLLMYGPIKPDPKDISPGMREAISLQCALNHASQLKSLVKSTNVNQQDEDGDRYPLHWAAARGHTQCALLLMRAGANVNLRDAANKTAADLARELNQHAMYELLMDETELEPLDA